MDETEEIRKELVREINATLPERERLEIEYGKGNVWDTKELSERFEVQGFMAPFCVVRDRATGKKGTVMFTHHPRFYFRFDPVE